MRQENENREIAIQLSGVKKEYKLGQIGGGSLQSDLQSWWAKKRGKEDPNSKIGEKQRLVGKTFRALNGIDLTVCQGEALGIIGANGAGKSTLLKLLSRVTAPSDGEIDIYGRITSMLEVGTGFHTEMTGRENVYMNGAILGMTKSEIDKKIEDIIDFSEVRDFIDTPVKRYSSGMYVKLAFSVAAHLDSEIMIMDEVLAVGDMAFQKKCLNKMKDVATKEGRTILYVSHNMNTIRQLCDRCIVLDQGKIVYDGNVENAIEVYLGTSYKMAKKYYFDDSYHSSYKTKDNLRLESLEIINSENLKYSYGDPIEMKIQCKTKEMIRDVKLRFEIQYQDGSKIGTSFTNQTVDFKEAGTEIIKLTLDTTHIPPGKYRVDIVAYNYNTFGSEVFLDGVYPGFHFEIDDKINENNELIWLHRFWGHIHLHDIIVN